MARRIRVFVLSGGGARGALQVGALRALLEAGELPDMLVGTSIGACNSAFVAINGVSPATIDRLADLWREAAVADLLPRDPWLTLEALVRRVEITRSELRIRKFWTDHGLHPGMQFGQIQGVRLILVSADLNSGQPVLHGTSPDDSIFEGMLASAALPPWIRPCAEKRPDTR
jgi:NTE family protein